MRFMWTYKMANKLAYADLACPALFAACKGSHQIRWKFSELEEWGSITSAHKWEDDGGGIVGKW